MQSISLQAQQLKKSYNRRVIFSDVNFSLRESNSLAIVGRNGSGKSTLLKILAGVLSSSEGETVVTCNGSRVKPADMFQYIGFVAPYLQLYEEFSALENLEIFKKIRCLDVPETYPVSLLEKVNLEHRKHDLVRTYSSGMKQRLKFAFALLHRPPILLLDEPSSNLDVEGIASVYQIVEEQKKQGIVVIATNDPEEMRLCEQSIDLNSQATTGGGKI